MKKRGHIEPMSKREIQYWDHSRNRCHLESKKIVTEDDPKTEDGLLTSQELYSMEMPVDIDCYKSLERLQRKARGGGKWE